MIKASRELAEEQSAVLGQAYPDAHCELVFDSAFTLLVATVLSAQTTDSRVNQVTPTLFDQWGDPNTMMNAPLVDLELVLRPLGMYRRRASALRGLSEDLVTKFEGVVPETRAELMSLPGVGRKTANVVLGNWFGRQEITVDTHVGRVTRRLGWSSQKDPLKVEKELWELLPDAPWTQLCHELIFHGRQICHARVPQCGACPLVQLCPSAELAEAL